MIATKIFFALAITLGGSAFAQASTPFYQLSFQRSLEADPNWKIEEGNTEIHAIAQKLIDDVYSDIGQTSHYDYEKYLVRRKEGNPIFTVGLIETPHGYFFHKVGYASQKCGMKSFGDLFKLIKETDGWFMQNRNYMMTLIPRLFEKHHMNLPPAPISLVKMISDSIRVPGQPHRRYRARAIAADELNKYKENGDIVLKDLEALEPFVYFVEKSDKEGNFSGKGKAKMLNGRPIKLSSTNEYEL